MTKKTIMVFDIPAEHGGALSILKDFYNDVKNETDKSINWIFVLSKPKFEETENIKVLNFLWVKKSWFHRLFFDIFIAHRLVKKYKTDKIFSLQNMIIPFAKIEQILYMHQSLPFSEYKFSVSENFIFWIYQNIIGKKIINSIKKANQVIVQTNWIKEECIKKSGISSNKIHVIPPKLKIEIKEQYTESNSDKITFFYPAGGIEYKNHKIILDACNLLKEENISNYEVIFTLDKYENKYSKLLYEKAQLLNLPIQFIGKIDRNRVFEYYKNSVLIFPSYIETFGLPLLEARMHNTPVIALETKFGKEILEGYSNTYFFKFSDYEELKEILKGFIKKEIIVEREKKSKETKNNNVLEYLK